ncbi:YrhK domain-containing protein [Mesobacillus thioparans]
MQMRFLYKRQSIGELEEDLAQVWQVMSSGWLVLIDLLFYSFILTLLTSPVTFTVTRMTGTFIIIYFSLACLFLLIRKAAKGKDADHIR